MKTGVLADSFVWLLRLSLILTLPAAGVLAASDSEANNPVGPIQIGEVKKKIGDGDIDMAARELSKAIDQGYDDFYVIAYDGALSPLRTSAHWAGITEQFEAKQPWASVLSALLNKKGSLYDRYRLVVGWEESDVSTPPKYAAPIRQVGGSIAGFMGEYQKAASIGETRGQNLDFVRSGHFIPTNALEEVLHRAGESRVVLLNELHHRSETRASNLLLVRELARLGFTHIALEALTRSPSAVGCDSASLNDSELFRRGYAAAGTGYYFNDPVYAELLFEAIELGLRPIAYDVTGPGMSGPDREQYQAENIACLLRDPSAKVIVVGGHGHISEATGARNPDGLMGARLAKVSGLDPISIATRVLDPSTENPRVQEALEAMSRDFGPWLMADRDGEVFSQNGYDMTVFVPSIASRSESRELLELRGTRRPITVSGIACKAASGCILEAILMGRNDTAVASDRCQMKTGALACTLYLKSGEYSIRSIALGSEGRPQAVQRLLVQ